MKACLLLTILALSMPFIPIKAQESINIHNYTPTWEHINVPVFKLPLYDNYCLKLQYPENFNIDTSLHGDINSSLANFYRQYDTNSWNPQFKSQMVPTEKPYTWHNNIYSRDFTQSGKLKTWDNGHIFGFSSYKSYPAIGNIGSAGFGISHNFNERLNFTGNISFNKYNIPRITYNSYTLNGHVSYQFNNNFSISVFSNYESYNFINNTPIQYPYDTNFGGYISATTNNNAWGMDLGVQKYYDPYKRKWITRPIIRPFYNLAGTKLGCDFGELLFLIIDSANLINNKKGWDARYDNKLHNRDNILLPRNN